MRSVVWQLSSARVLPLSQLSLLNFIPFSHSDFDTHIVPFLEKSGILIRERTVLLALFVDLMSLFNWRNNVRTWDKLVNHCFGLLLMAVTAINNYTNSTKLEWLFSFTLFRNPTFFLFFWSPRYLQLYKDHPIIPVFLSQDSQHIYL